MPQWIFLPKPKEVKFSGASFKVPRRGWIVLDLSPLCAGAVGFNIAEQLAQGLELAGGTIWNIVRDAGRLPQTPAAEIRCIQDQTIRHQQGYTLSISAAGVVLKARTPAGLFYAVQTLLQLARQVKGRRWPALKIADWPDFHRRGVYHDCARGKVPQLGTILQLVDDLGRLKINEFQLYMENAYEFRRHPAMCSDTTPFTAEELMMIDGYCKARFIDFVPSLTSLGHFEKILKRPQYRKLGEIEPRELQRLYPDMKVTWDAPWTLNVTDPAARRLLKDMFDEYLPNFTSPFFNICCDESWDLGKGKSKRLADKIGTGQLYVDWIHFCDGLAKTHGRTLMLWADIIRDHPTKLRQLPKDAILLEWGYEAAHDFDGRLPLVAKAGRRFYVCPGTSVWQTLTGRSRNAFANGRAAALAGAKHGAAGYLLTDWGDFGHQQMLAVSLLPMAFGAAMSWNVNMTDDQALRAASLHLFGDPSGDVAGAVYELGLLHELTGCLRANATVDFWLFREPWQKREYLDRVAPADMRKLRAAAKAMESKLARMPIDHPDAELIRAELVHSARVVRHTADRTLARKAILAGRDAGRGKLVRLALEAQNLRDEFTALWHARNKPSRIADVLKHWDRLIAEYRLRARTPARS